MKFSRLRVLGFKSFVEPMELVIQDGLTGVVGPNGCGKSNLVEALRWVMGENSYKNMRASGMDDVIFSGSLNRPARNSAEVTLFLDNTDRTAPAAFNDSDMLEVTRRIERESGSTYRINGREVRARDVQLLFADASTGARSPAMVRQGQIGEMISAKPTARRKILEEAAGISGLHSRRNEAESRLRAAETNLDRLEDVLVQIEGQLEGLKRQARQAVRYRNLSSEIRKADAAISYLRWQEATQALEVARKQYVEAEVGLRDISVTQAQTAREQAIAAHEVPKLREAAAAKGAAVQRLTIAKNDLDGEERRIKERLTDIARRLEQINETLSREEELLEENASVLAKLEEEAEGLTEEAELEEERALTAQETVWQARGALQEIEVEHTRKTQEQAGLIAKRQQLDMNMSSSRAKVQRFQSLSQELSEQLKIVSEEIAMASGPRETREALEMAREALAEAEEEAEAAASEVVGARDAVETAKEPLANQRAKLSEAETEARTLSQILSAGQSDQWTAIVDEIEVDAGLEQALGAALGQDLDVPLESDAPSHWSGAKILPGDPSLPKGAEPFSTFVRAPKALGRRLSQIGLVTAELGQQLSQELKTGQALVSKEGAFWRWDGLVVAPDAPTPSAIKLSQKNRLAELEILREELEEQLEVLSELVEDAQTKLAVASEREHAARQSLRVQQSNVMAANEAFAAAERALTQLSMKRSSLEEQQRRAEQDTEEAQMLVEELMLQLEELPETEELEEALAELAASVAAKRSDLSQAQLAADSIERDRQSRKLRLGAIVQEKQRWIERGAKAKEQLETLKARETEALEEREMLLEAPEELEGRRLILSRELDKAEQELKAANDALVEGEARQTEADRKAKEALEGLSGIRERKVRAEERLEAAKSHRREIERWVDETLEIQVTELFSVAELKEGAPLPDQAATERKLERLKAERERLGGVNLRAEQEVREVEEHFSTLITERDDLIEAIKRLRGGIGNLNKEARERLLTSFEIVNDHFQRLFTHLFGGGTAELKLVDSEDPLEAGLEIFARPPGKKPQTMTLLSGGEQALTAMALIFAVFLTNPAPICVLDEVDAPLDDANVERYCSLLEDMSANTETRFAVITHNPITMARMNRLFGVTMAERGVSQLVSVDLETAEGFREAS
ncbi:chromosome segregation protein SMC [Rhodobacteraceae bacterium RKSG542]|uniref:chromosome segregation protein SMC n=1 Tax=Pseudovibrio flavus TaxID=2529854 RepID=UPI0012BC38FD|nr:chromosome segregation protein SMC [Pseudovibrio flavus]MTI18679.1 chromosome segregation protein SMC [Pseudovibrio flavus]